MRSGKFLVIFSASLFVAGVLTVCLSPLLVAGGLRLWAARAARQGHLQIALGRIEAPFLGPVIVHDLHVTSDSSALFRVDAVAPRLEIDLNLAAALGLSDGRSLRALRADGIAINIRRDATALTSSPKFPWENLETLLSDNFRFSGVRLHVENGGTTVDVHDGTLSGSQLKAGIFGARALAITSTWFSKNFSNLRGATSWQGSHLVIGALSVMRGLDLDTIDLDLSRIGESRIGIEVNLDAFGGKIRARVSSDDRGDKRTWDIAGNGSGVSLAQMSDALEWSNRASGSLHASKFTFRGEMNDLRNATAALWAEVSGLTWRDRTADTVMIGASLNNRTVQIEQLYLKQRNNQLTLSGEFGWPDRLADWLLPAFHGDISAAINDLGDFARLFGGASSDFAGRLTATGKVTAEGSKLGGQFSASGQSLILFRSPIESLEMKFGLEDSRLEITQLELHEKDDFLRGEGTFALTGDRSYSAAVQVSVAELANYAGLIPSRLLPFPLGGSVTAEWKGRGTNETDSGSWHARGRNLRLGEGAFLPFEAELAADYSPESIFFRDFHLWNPRAELSSFVTLAENYVHAQDMRLTLNGQSRLEGNVYLPLSVAKIRSGSRCLAALSSDPFFEVDLGLDNLDLAELAAATKAKADMSGNATGRIQFSGTPASLQGRGEFHLRDFSLDASPVLSADLETQVALGMANFKVTAASRGSSPAKAEGTVPFQLQKRDAEYTFASDGPLSVSLDFPAIFLGNLPHYLARGIFTRGILSGNLVIGDSLRQPLITGTLNLIDGQLLRGSAISGGLTLSGRHGAVDFLHVRGPRFVTVHNGNQTLDVSARGNIDFANLDAIELKIFPAAGVMAYFPGLIDDDCVGSVEFYPTPIPHMFPAPSIQEIGLTSSLFGGQCTIAFSSPYGADPPQVFRFCRDSSSPGKTLLLITPAP